MNAPHSAMLPRCQFSNIYEQYSGRLMRYLLQQGLATQDTEDVAQEVWIRIWKNIHRFDGRDFVAWMLKIARNCIVDWFRRVRKNHDRLRELSENFPAKFRSADASGLNNDSIERLRKILQQKKCVFMEAIRSQLEGEAVQVTASRLNVSVNTIYTRRNRGRKRLQNLIPAMLD